MNRLVSLLLIPMFVLGHALPHSHAGTGVVEPDGHSIRAHIHLAGGHHHDHDDDDHKHRNGDLSDTPDSETPTPESVSVPIDHDSDAIYLSNVDGAVSQRAATPRVDSSDQAYVSLVWSILLDECARCRFGDPPDRYAGLPIYLLTASLRL